jgi:hypothetical protein
MMSPHALSDTNTATPSEPKTAPANDDEARVTATVEQTKRTNEDTEHASMLRRRGFMGPLAATCFSQVLIETPIGFA